MNIKTYYQRPLYSHYVARVGSNPIATIETPTSKPSTLCVTVTVNLSGGFLFQGAARVYRGDVFGESQGSQGRQGRRGWGGGVERAW
jgi:hypothetical protein